MFTSPLLVFVPMPALGTFIHELSHYSVATAVGFDATLHYRSTTWETPIPSSEMAELLVVLAGPLVGITIGTFGLCWLVSLDRRGHLIPASTKRGWVPFLLTLFWARQVFTAIFALLKSVVSGGWTLTDETIACLMLGLPLWVLPAILGGFGVAVCVRGVRLFVPVPNRALFLAGALVGCGAGWVLWMHVLGPWLLP